MLIVDACFAVQIGAMSLPGEQSGKRHPPHSPEIITLEIAEQIMSEWKRTRRSRRLKRKDKNKDNDM